MGYTTEFEGEIKIEPALSQELTSYINKFSNTRRMKRNTNVLKNMYNGEFGFRGKYGIDGEFYIGDDDCGIIDNNEPPRTQPGLWCDWEVTDDGQYIQWNGSEKFYDAEIWMEYIINNFIGKDHTCNGTIHAQGEYFDDQWDLIVENSKVKVVR